MKCSIELCSELLKIIETQNALIAKLANENYEQEAFINELMRDHVEDTVQLSE